jgi:hypothetical protein
VSTAKPSPLPEGAFVVRLDASTLDVESPASLAAQIPHADTRPAGSTVALSPVATRKRGALGRLIGDAHVKVPRVARCTALLARGYVGIAAEGADVWGGVPASPA